MEKEENNRKRVKKIVSKTEVSTTTLYLNKPHKKSNKCSCKALDPKTHSFCSKSCGCSKIGNQCSLKCGCNGICSNGKPISDELFFKVWRNKVIRTEIIGDKNLKIIREKNQFKKELLEMLNRFKIRYNEDDIDGFTKLFGRKSNPEINVTNILGRYFKIEKENRLLEFKTHFRLHNDDNGNSNLFRGNKSDVIMRYVNALLPEDQLKLPPIKELIIEELKIIESIKERIKLLFQQQEGLEFNIHSRNIILFIQDSGGGDIDSLISNERQQQATSKRNKIIQTLFSMGIYSIHYQKEIEAHSNTFRQNEIISKNVWSFDQIINAEKKFKECITKENLTIH